MTASIDLLRTLVAFDTTSRNSNLDLIDHVGNLLEDAGLQPWLTHDAEGRKANLFATLPAADGSVAGGVVLSGHTDVVPVDGQDWDSDPFTVTERDGRLYGRGTADMKGFIACALAKLPVMKSAGLAAPIHFALSFDEEIGCLGAPLMIDQIAARGLSPSGCLIGEPTSMRPVIAHKGINIYRCQVHGRSAHSALPALGVNAIEYAARLIVFIRELADGMRRDGPLDEFFDTPYSTAQTGTIKGGTQSNVVPELCEFVFEFRNLPQIDATAVLGEIQGYIDRILAPAMRAEHPEAGFSVEPIATAPGLSSDEAAEISKLVRALTQDDDIRKVAYGTEGGQFQAAGIPSIICGPGDIAQAHRANEFVEISQMERCDAFLESLIARQSQEARA